MTNEKIARINELARKSRAQGLTEQERAEQAALRREYIDAMKRSLKVQLDSTVLVEPDGTAALKFSAINQGYDTDVISLESVEVDGQRVEMDKAQPLHRDQSIIADSQKNLDATTQQDSETVQYIATTLKNDDFGYAGSRPVTFEFSNGSIDVDATIAATQMQSGEFDRDVESSEGYSSEAPKN